MEKTRTEDKKQKEEMKGLITGYYALRYMRRNKTSEMFDLERTFHTSWVPMKMEIHLQYALSRYFSHIFLPLNFAFHSQKMWHGGN